MYGIVLPGPNVENGVMIVKGGDVKPDRLSPDRLCKTTREIEAGYVRSRLRGGDLVMAIRGGVGDIEIVPAEIEGANLTQDAARIAPRHGVLNYWLRYALQAPSVFAPLGAGANGAAVRGINIFDLDRVLVPTPSTAEQTAIADRLGIKEQQIKRMREKICEHAELIRELRAALITAAVAGQIDVATWSKRGTTDQRLDAIEADMVSAAQPERQQVRA
jgi:type I restriction enzyme S subunit